MAHLFLTLIHTLEICAYIIEYNEDNIHSNVFSILQAPKLFTTIVIMSTPVFLGFAMIYKGNIAVNVGYAAVIIIVFSIINAILSNHLQHFVRFQDSMILLQIGILASVVSLIHIMVEEYHTADSWLEVATIIMYIRYLRVFS